MAKQNQVILRLEIDGNKAFAVLDNGEKKLINLGKAADKTGDIGRKIFDTAVLTGALYLLQSIGKSVFDLSLQGAKLSNLKEAFEGTEADLQNLRKATAGTVDDASLIKLSNQATDLGVSLDQQAILFALAENAGDKYGTSVEEGFAKVLAATEGSSRGLKSLGIQKEVYEQEVRKLASAYGVEIEKLDAATQKQIQLEAIIKSSGMSMADVTNKMQDNADKMESATVAWANFKDVIGELLGPGTAWLLNNFVEGLQRIAGMTDNLQKVLNNARGTVQSSFVQSLAGTDAAYRKKLYDDLTVQLKENKKILTDLGKYSELGRTNAQNQAFKSARINYDIFDTQRKALIAYENKLKETGEKTVTIQKSQAEYNKEAAEQKKRQADIAAAILATEVEILKAKKEQAEFDLTGTDLYKDGDGNYKSRKAAKGFEMNTVSVPGHTPTTETQQQLQDTLKLKEAYNMVGDAGQEAFDRTADAMAGSIQLFRDNNNFAAMFLNTLAQIVLKALLLQWITSITGLFSSLGGGGATAGRSSLMSGGAQPIGGVNIGPVPFAKGGIVTSPTLAMIGEAGSKEAVIPLERLHQFTGGAGLQPLINVMERQNQKINAWAASLNMKWDGKDFVADSGKAEQRYNALRY
jgi:hypothetical protein